MSVIHKASFGLGAVYENSLCNKCYRNAVFIDKKAGDCFVVRSYEEDDEEEILCRKCRDVIGYSDYTKHRQVKEYLRGNNHLIDIICIALRTKRVDRILDNKDEYDYDICFDIDNDYDSRNDALFEKISGADLNNCVIYEYDTAFAFDECFHRISVCPRFCAYLQLGTIYEIEWIKTDHGLIMKLLFDTESC